MGAAIERRGLIRRCGNLLAVAGLDLDVPEGSVLGLLGPNGAGQSSTARMLAAAPEAAGMGAAVRP